MKVLVIDDDVVSRMVLMHLVDSSGKFDIHEAEDGQDAWEQLDGGLRPDLCFCDLRMPRLSGMDLLKKIKAVPALAAIPFILVSSATDADIVEQANDSGAAGYIVKPFQAEQVKQHLAPLLAASGRAKAVSETPLATQQRLGIGSDRLLVYLGGFQTQLASASTDIATLLARGEQREAQLRLDRLHAGCVTLGLGGAAAEIKLLDAGTLAGEAVRVALASTAEAVRVQIEQVRQLAVPTGST